MQRYSQKYSKIAALAGAIAISASMGAGVALAHGNEAGLNVKAQVKTEENAKVHQKTMVGTVTSVNGNSIVFTAKNNTSFTVDVTNAKLSLLHGGKLLASQIAVGDRVQVRGSVNGSNVTATMLRDLSLRRAVMSGKVSAVSGNTITLNTKNNRTVSVNSSTTYSAKTGTVSLANVVVGAYIRAEGLLNHESKVLNAEKVKILVPVSVSTSTSTSNQ